MDQRAMVRLEVKKEERTYCFDMPIGAPFGEAYDAAFEVLSTILKMSEEAVAKAEQKKEKEDKEKPVSA
jgi:predicted adenine nucleotide alpha hydrolase (AANH) superfamily ATPase